MAVPRLRGLFAIALLLLTACGPDIDSLRAEGDVQGLIEALSDDSAEIRADAARALGQLSASGASEAVDPLLGALADDDADVRAAAAQALGRIGDETAIVPLLRAMDDDAAVVREDAEFAFTTLLSHSHSRAAAAELVDALGDESATVRAAAAETLALLGPEVGPVLVDALTHENPFVRSAAADALGDVGDPSAVVPLLQASTDDSADVRDTAQRALADLLNLLSDFDSVSALVTALEDPDPAVADAADSALTEYLARIGPERSLPALSQAGASDAWLALALGVPEEQLAAETRRRGIQLEPLDVIESTVAVVRDGTPVPAAHPYQASAAFHPAVVLESEPDSGEASPWQASREAWAPSAVRFVELVVIEEIVWEELEVCLYNGPSITRSRPHQTIRVVSAIDAQLVAEQTYTGSDPRLCQETEAYNLTELRGDVDLSAAIPWLESLINPP